ncbi:nitrate/nitrite transporter NarK [Leeuwenhoekiella aestuarii]|uniref:Nitrate/nitrite transporter NarK n=1 Tax=Leeuwenhoekiella aestuarii TaxID=2249426 RepID=A0A4Q0NV19_9FLAO|nr:MFS transporter [Leeuwenhoekiella aestuarii]RXG15571.1 nitrate/nitrite transporter NarK [Leeuwenhoekiella aestuarii]RXG17322.1 nitrate/nitrite transporter NarK [Leeuwenhoekiella aestuarii]
MRQNLLNKLFRIPVLQNSRIIILIVLAQFLGTSLWFVGNIVIPQLPVSKLGNESILGDLLATVQFGFIAGSLVFALLSIADRFSPSKVFLVCAFLGATTNLALILPEIQITSLLISRFTTGFFLAGIYPVGMKIASDYYEKGLGKALGYLVGALVLGTALPHFLNSFGVSIDYKTITITTSALAVLGGILIGYGVPNGPFRKQQQKLKMSGIPALFKVKAFRRAAFGYWGHMWELYAFWGFLPLFIKFYAIENEQVLNIPLWAFITIGLGTLSCAIGGHLSKRFSSKKVALISLVVSGICCLLSPFSILFPTSIFFMFFLIWGAAVVSDSPQFSTLIATHAIPQYRGTALTFVNSLGFAITIASIQLLAYFSTHIGIKWIFIILAIGPIFGILSLRKSA